MFQNFYSDKLPPVHLLLAASESASISSKLFKCHVSASIKDESRRVREGCRKKIRKKSGRFEHILTLPIFHAYLVNILVVLHGRGQSERFIPRIKFTPTPNLRGWRLTSALKIVVSFMLLEAQIGTRLGMCFPVQFMV